MKKLSKKKEKELLALAGEGAKLYYFMGRACVFTPWKYLEENNNRCFQKQFLVYARKNN